MSIGGSGAARSRGTVTIEIAGVGPTERTLRRHVTGRLTQALRRVHSEPVSVHADFFDDNGPKGGRGRRCALTVRIPRRRALHVEHIAESPRLAFDAAFQTLDRRLAELLERGRDLRRRPKKYFVARRLLATPGTESS